MLCLSVEKTFTFETHDGVIVMDSGLVGVKGFSALDKLRELVNVVKVKTVKFVAKKFNDEGFFVAVVNGDALSKNVSLVRSTCNFAFRDLIGVSF